MTINKFAKLAVSVSQMMIDSEKFTAPVLASKLRKYAQQCPTDQTLVMMANVIGKLADKQTFITRAELKRLYNQFYVRNNKCAQVLKDELGDLGVQTTPKLYERDSGSEVDISVHADQILVNALDSVFDGSVPLKLYSKAASELAQNSVKRALNSWNLGASNINIEAGNEKVLIVKAEYDTPKGRTSFYIPVEIKDNKIVEASDFIGNIGPQELNHVNIKSYLASHAGSKLKVTGSQLLSLIDNSMNGKSISDTEFALAKLKASRASKEEYFANQITGQELNKVASADVSLPKLAETELFENKFNSPEGIAEFSFGGSNVRTGFDLVNRALNSFGHKGSRIKVAGSNDNTILYAVAINGGQVGFTVPVKVASNKVTLPTVILHNGTLSKFNSETLSKMCSTNSDSKVAAYASPVHGLKPSDLINEVREAMIDQNTARAEDALNVLRESGDEKAYAFAFKAFTDGLANKTADKEECKCSMIIKSSASKHPVCGHTGLPTHKVYQDKFGNCLPLYRRGMNESYEGGYFMNHKIFG